MNLADLVVVGYGVLVGFCLGVAVTGAIALRRIGVNPDAGPADGH